MKSSSTAKRPTLLSVLCVMGLFGCFLKTIFVIAPSIQSYGRLYAVYLSVTTVLMIACLCGLWLMKKWAFWTFSIYFIVNAGVYWGMGILDPKTFFSNTQAVVSFALVPLTLLTTLFYYRRLS
jgi:hypothetical protein